MDEDMNEEFTMDPERRLQTTLGVCLGEAFCASGFVHPKALQWRPSTISMVGPSSGRRVRPIGGDKAVADPLGSHSLA